LHQKKVTPKSGKETADFSIFSCALKGRRTSIWRRGKQAARHLELIIQQDTHVNEHTSINASRFFRSSSSFLVTMEESIVSLIAFGSDYTSRPESTSDFDLVSLE